MKLDDLRKRFGSTAVATTELTSYATPRTHYCDCGRLGCQGRVEDGCLARPKVKANGPPPGMTCKQLVAGGRVCGREVRAPCGKCDGCCGHWTPDGSNACFPWYVARPKKTGQLLLVRFFSREVHVAGWHYTAGCAAPAGDLSPEHFWLGDATEVTCEKCRERGSDYVAEYIVDELVLEPRKSIPRYAGGDGPLEPLIKARYAAMSPILCEHANECPSVCPCEPPCYCHGNACKTRKLKHPKGPRYIDR